MGFDVTANREVKEHAGNPVCNIRVLEKPATTQFWGTTQPVGIAMAKLDFSTHYVPPDIVLVIFVVNTVYTT